MELDERKLKILQAIIDDYVVTGIPVGSRTVARKYMEWSSATIRNEMSDLEEMGYLEQPHASAGRKPSDKAYRLYVEKIMREAKLTHKEIEYVKNNINRRINDISELMMQTARILGTMTNYAAVVLAPQMNRVIIRHIQLVPVTKEAALLVVVTDGGIIKDTIVYIGEGMTSDQLYALSNIMTKKTAGLPVEEAELAIRELINSELTEHRQTLGSIIDAINKNVSEKKDVVLGGATNILKHPEYSDVQRASEFLASLDEKEKLIKLMSNASTVEFQFTIGSENQYDNMRETSMVTAIYGSGGIPLGTIGVIGPTRMDYAHVLSILRLVGRGMSDVLDYMAGIEKEPDGEDDT